MMGEDPQEPRTFLMTGIALIDLSFHKKKDLNFLESSVTRTLRANCPEMTGWKLLLAVAILLPTATRAKYVQCPAGNLAPIVPKGKRFFHSMTGEYFPIKGIAYYPRPNDGDLSITNSVDFFTDQYRDRWEADIQYFRQLGINTIRIYSVDPSQNHDNFMCALQEAGIYVILGLLADCYECGIGPNEAPSCYPDHLKQRGQWIINEFSKYTNLLLFSAGNEATLYARNRQIEINAPCQKKFLRDMRSYVNTCSAIPASILPRKVPIGLVTWDAKRALQASYFNCRTDPNDEMENAEWYGLNAYLHCNPNAMTVDQLSGWILARQDFAAINLSVPVVIAEFGCREPFPAIGEFEAQRTWLQIDALYSSQYVEEFAGGVVFEYSAEKRIADQSDQGTLWPYYEFTKLQYGVGYFSPIDCDHTTIPCEYNPYPEFDLLRAKFEVVDNSFVPHIDSYVPDGQIPGCPSGFAPLSNFTWPVDDFPDLPCYLVPTSPPTMQPSTSPQPSTNPSNGPTPVASASPTRIPSSDPTTMPSALPSTAPPSSIPSIKPSSMPSLRFSSTPSKLPTMAPSTTPASVAPSGQPTIKPTTSLSPSDQPSIISTTIPSAINRPGTSLPTRRPTASDPTSEDADKSSESFAASAAATSPHLFASMILLLYGTIQAINTI